MNKYELYDFISNWNYNGVPLNTTVQVVDTETIYTQVRAGWILYYFKLGFTDTITLLERVSWLTNSKPNNITRVRRYKNKGQQYLIIKAIKESITRRSERYFLTEYSDEEMKQNIHDLLELVSAYETVDNKLIRTAETTEKAIELTNYYNQFLP